MPKSETVFVLNDRVQHSVFGPGTIRQVDPRYTTIAFDENGIKKFLTDMVRLEHSDTPAPAKPARAKKVKA